MTLEPFAAYPNCEGLFFLKDSVRREHSHLEHFVIAHTCKYVFV